MRYRFLSVDCLKALFIGAVGMSIAKGILFDWEEWLKVLKSSKGMSNFSSKLIYLSNRIKLNACGRSNPSILARSCKPCG